MSKSNSPFVTTTAYIVVAFFGALLVIRVDTGGTVWLKFILYVLLFIAIQKTIKRFHDDRLIRKS